MGKIYRLDLLTLIENLQLHSATLTAELPAGTVAGVFEECKGFISLRNGEIIKSAIIGKSGPQVSGPDALKYLRTIKRWLVEEEENTPGEQAPAAPPQSMPPQTSWAGTTPWPNAFPVPQNLTIIPYQQMLLPDALLQRLNHRERMIVRLVFMMVNGQRSITQIKEQLQLPAETIDYILEELRRLGVIAW